MRVRERGTIFDATAAEPAARFCTFPSLARTAGGRLVAGFRVGSSKDSADEDVRVMVSDDEGATWQMAFGGFGAFPPGSGGRIRGIALTPLGRRLIASLLWVDRSNPALPLASPETQGLLRPGCSSPGRTTRGIRGARRKKYLSCHTKATRPPAPSWPWEMAGSRCPMKRGKNTMIPAPERTMPLCVSRPTAAGRGMNPRSSPTIHRAASSTGISA